MISFKTSLRVRYAETDQMGYLYYGNYAQYYEVGRVEFLRSLGLTYSKLESEYEVMMPVVNMDARFIRPALYDDLITIETSLRVLPENSITFHMELKNEAGKIINGGRVKLCFVDARSKKRIPAPKVLLDLLEPHF